MKIKQQPFIHMDMDAFYPAVEVLDRPELKGKPVIVGGSKERGVVSSASYEARKNGVHSAQPMATAMRLCPEAIVLPGRMRRYKEISDRIFDIFKRFTPLVEPLSIDEAFLDVAGSVRLFGPPVDIAKKIKKAVFNEIGLTVSAGVAPSKFVAKIASDMDKPDGLTVVPVDGVRSFLDPLPIEKMWGAGKVTQKALAELHIHTFRELRLTPVEILENKFGKHGLKMHTLAMGIDKRVLEPDHDAKSIGHEQTFAEDIINITEAKERILFLTEKVAHRMRYYGVTGRTITLKVKYNDFTRATRSETLKKVTDDAPEIYAVACRLLEKTSVGTRPARLLGVSVSHLSDCSGKGQLYLFNHTQPDQKRKELHTALDALYEKFGDKGIRPGTLINK